MPSRPSPSSDFRAPILAGLAALTLYNRALQTTVALSRAAALANPVSAGLVIGTATVLAFKGAWDEAGDSVEAFQDALKASQGDIAAQTALIQGLREAPAEQRTTSPPTGFSGHPEARSTRTRSSTTSAESLGMETASEQMTAAPTRPRIAEEPGRRRHDGGGADGRAAHRHGTGGRGGTGAGAGERRLIESMHALREEALRARNANSTTSSPSTTRPRRSRRTARPVDKTTDAGRGNLRALYNLAGAWNGQSEVIKGNIGQLRAAKANFIDTATAMGFTAKKARNLAKGGTVRHPGEAGR